MFIVADLVFLMNYTYKYAIIRLRDFFFQSRGTEGKKNGHFQSFFSIISRTNSQTSKVNQQSV